MKRDLNVIRDILLAIESHEGDYWLDLKKIPHDLRTVVYHGRLLLDDGYIEASYTPSTGEPYIGINRLTNKGHDFLDNIRNASIWKKVIKTTTEKGSSFALDLVSKLASKYVSETIGLGN